jgi:hypothetical protein
MVESSMARSQVEVRQRRATAASVAAALALAGGIFLAAPAAEARGFVGLSLGLPLGPAYPAYYPPPAYYYPPPPVYYGPPPVAYAPPPVAYAPPPAQATAARDTCREYQSTATIDGRPQQTYGLACRQPDGTWRIVK